jgi:hypothetical protein
MKIKGARPWAFSRPPTTFPLSQNNHSTHLQQIDGTHHVIAVVQKWLFHALPNSLDCRKMNHAVNLVLKPIIIIIKIICSIFDLSQAHLTENFAEGLNVQQVTLHELEVLASDLLDAVE